ncbi:DUF6169 family protein [Spirosoma gilvum]
MLSGTPDPYSFTGTGSAVNIYTFRTESGAIYAVRFKPTPYLFENAPIIAEQVYELVIEQVRLPIGRTGVDRAIAVTIAEICRDFFKNQERILLYICETSDFKQLARVRKFDGWFRQFNDHRYLKLDTQFPDSNGITYFVSLIFRWEHPHLHTIIDAFEGLSEQYNAGK